MASRVRHLGAAKSGTREAWRMRLTNFALLPLAIAFIWIVLRLAGKDLAGVKAEFAHPCTAIFMLLFILVGIVHMKLGMQSIIDDYVHAARLKEWSMAANALFSIGFGVAAIYAVLKLSLA
ncbi:MAG TPA: succinate dehydrogenase, hydrophobic membrane anchor protein [Methylovirgula sp.]|nr:succinate dehydrogenase, hydrophobic membrane anchor protein [Methylovirgula sp.]